MYELVNIFEIFLPQLLAYPNPHSPMNIDAANLLDFSTEEYERTVRVHVEKYAARQKNEERQEADGDAEANGGKKAVMHKVSTDCEDLLEADLSDLSQLSELSDTSDILFEEEIL